MSGDAAEVLPMLQGGESLEYLVGSLGGGGDDAAASARVALLLNGMCQPTAAGCEGCRASLGSLGGVEALGTLLGSPS